jgi:hypothetical protein
MGFWQQLLGRTAPKEQPQRRRGQRGKARTPADRLAAMEAAYLSRLKRHNPREYDRVMARLFERRHSLGDDGGEISQLARSMAALKDLGLVKDSTDDGWIKDAIQGAAMILGARPAPPVGTAPETPTAVVSELPAPEPAIIQSAPAVAAVAAPPSSNGHVVAGAPPSPIAAHVIGQLADKAPEEAAGWLLKQRHPQARELVRQLCTTPDEELPALLDRLASSSPELASLAAWLAERGEWVQLTVYALRRMTGQYPPPPKHLNVGM